MLEFREGEIKPTVETKVRAIGGNGKGSYIILEHWPDKRIYFRLVHFPPSYSHLSSWGPIEDAESCEIRFNAGKEGDVNEIKEVIMHGKDGETKITPLSVTDDDEKNHKEPIN